MNIFEKYFGDELYHGYVIENNNPDIVSSLLSYLEEKNIISKINPDVLVQEYDSMSVSDVEYIHSWHMNHNTSEACRVCIINTKFINHEAQHALLKILEEPKNNTKFFIIIGSVSNLLATIISRVHVIHIPNLKNTSDTLNKENIEFIKMSVSDRITYISELIKEYKDTESSGSLRYKATSICSGLEYFYYQEFKKDKNNPKTHFVLEELSSARKYLSVPGCSVKMILEHIALVL